MINEFALKEKSMAIITRYFIAGIVVVSIAHAYSLSALAQNTNPNVWRTNVNKQFGFRISYPNDWKVIPPKGPK